MKKEQPRLITRNECIEIATEISLDIVGKFIEKWSLETLIPKLNDRLVSESECKIITGLSRVSRWKLYKKGLFPMPYKIDGITSCRWSLKDINEWLINHKKMHIDDMKFVGKPKYTKKESK